MEIADRRVRKLTQEISEQMAQERFPVPTAELELDAKTFYTVAAELLKLASSIIDDPAFTSDVVYKRFQAVLNHLVRHAYEKPDGVACSGWGFGPSFGPTLKAGS